MSDYVNMRILDCGYQSFSHLCLRLIEIAMDRSDHHVQRFKDFVAEVQCAIGEDFDFSPVENMDVRA